MATVLGDHQKFMSRLERVTTIDFISRRRANINFGNYLVWKMNQTDKTNQRVGNCELTVGEANCHEAKTICGGETPCERVYFTGRS